MNLPRLTGRGVSIARGDDPHALALERANGASLLRRVHQQYLERPRHRGGEHLLVRRSRDPELLRRYIDLPESLPVSGPSLSRPARAGSLLARCFFRAAARGGRRARGLLPTQFQPTTSFLTGCHRSHCSRRSTRDLESTRGTTPSLRTLPSLPH